MTGKIPLTLHVGHVSLSQVRSVVDEPLHSLLESGEAVDGRRFENESGIQRNESNQAAHRKLHRVPVIELDRIIVHAILLAPQAELILALPTECHRVGDKYEMLEELRRDVLVRGVVLREF